MTPFLIWYIKKEPKGSEFSVLNSGKKLTGTLPDSTGDYIIPDVLPSGSDVINGFYLTDYAQYRPIDMGYSTDGKSIVVLNATSEMVLKPYVIYYI